MHSKETQFPPRLCPAYIYLPFIILLHIFFTCPFLLRALSSVYYSPTPLFYNYLSVCLLHLIKRLGPYLILPSVLRDTEF